jgi:hypothetical protein
MYRRIYEDVEEEGRRRRRGEVGRGGSRKRRDWRKKNMKINNE